MLFALYKLQPCCGHEYNGFLLKPRSIICSTFLIGVMINTDFLTL